MRKSTGAPLEQALAIRHIRGMRAVRIRQHPRARLTHRQRQILERLAKGEVSKEIARDLGISTKTVEAHRANIRRKLGLRSREELIRYAVRNKIVEPF